MNRILGAATLALLALAGATRDAHAFCGFYINGAGAKLFNDATLVVLMREGTRTVLSMRNAYAGPPEDFALVVPVPVVLKEENVKTLPPDVLERVDALSAPRLVEYWERDPCAPLDHPKTKKGKSTHDFESADVDGRALGVTVEAKFAVGEYEIVILGAKDSTGLDTWLRLEGYKIPDGAEPLLRPYVAAGSKFFVAKVDVTKVKLVDGRATLSPLRVHYDSPDFTLPVRLGLVNSAGMQDLLVFILAREQRYEVANYANATIPTNLDVADRVRDDLGAFYAALFDATAKKHPGAVVTEYAWNSAMGACDPCPGPVRGLAPADLATLGADVAGPAAAGADFVLTRLHARYGKESLGEDLIFRAAAPIAGGRERLGAKGRIERGAVPAGVNNFQARYVIRHAWRGPVACAHPRRSVWGGPWAGIDYGGVLPARDVAFAKRGAVKLRDVLRSDVPELGIVRAKKTTPKPKAPKEDPTKVMKKPVEAP